MNGTYLAQEGSPKLQVIVPVRMAIEKADRFAASDRGFVDEKGSLAEEEPPPAQGGQTQEIPGIGRTGAKTATIAMSPKATVDDNRSQDKPDQRHLINGKESLREDESISDDGKEVLGTIPSLSILDPPPRQRHHQQQQQQQQQQRQQQQQIGASKDAEFTGRYLALKSSAWDWVITYFSTATHELDLLHLAHKTSPQLMEYANFISSCGDKTWEHVFHKQRATLVYGILGKMLEVHVFGHEMFGAAESQLAGLRAMDLKLIDEDGM